MKPVRRVATVGAEELAGWPVTEGGLVWPKPVA